LSEEDMVKNWEEHPMLKPRIEKVVVNLNVGKSGEPLEKANKVLKESRVRLPSRRKPRRPSETSAYARANQSRS